MSPLCRCTAAMQARIDHKNGTVHFGGLDVESDQLRDHISNLTARLTKAVALIHKAQDPEKEARRLKVRSTPLTCRRMYLWRIVLEIDPSPLAL